MIMIPAFFLILPKTYFDTGTPLCLSVLLLHKTCLGCGLTRAMMYIIHFDFKGAWELNKLSPFVFVAIGFYWTKYVIQTLKT